MDSESEGLKRQLARLEQTIQAEMEKGKVLQVCCWQAQSQLLCTTHSHACALQRLHSAILRMLQHRIMLLGHANEAAIMVDRLQICADRPPKPNDVSAA